MVWRTSEFGRHGQGARSTPCFLRAISSIDSYADFKLRSRGSNFGWNCLPGRDRGQPQPQDFETSNSKLRKLASDFLPGDTASSHRRTMAAEPLAAPLHISVTPRRIVTKLEESTDYSV